LAASFGPQARAALDQLAGGQNVSCHVRDRDHDGRLLATCHDANGNDMALELLKRGLAVSARGSITGTDLATPYLAAEQAAQAQKIGLWSVTLPAPVSFSATSTPTTAQSASAIPDQAKEAKVAPRGDKSVINDISVPPTPITAQEKVTADVLRQSEQDQADDSDWQPEKEVGFFERYQLLIAGGLMLATALSIIGALWAQKNRDKRDETRAVAAALRGELMAARGICIGRIKSIASEEEDKASTWPRIRTTLYQAYVGRLGLLGAELARQIAAIYGQSSDYASFYSPTGTAYDSSKKQALETLVRHIDEILPKLAGVEQTGFLPQPTYLAQSGVSLPRFSLPRSRFDRVLQSPPAAKKNQPTITPPPSFKTITAPVTKVGGTPPAAKETAYDPAPPASASATAATPPISPVALWEAVRNFIQNHRNAIAQTPSPDDEAVSRYAAMIEADMARYPYSGELEPLDITPSKRRG
jgi:hypothetical protein